MSNPHARKFSTGPPASTSGIDLYSFPTPNGLKVTVALEELIALGQPIEYKEHKIDISKNVQKEPWFLEEINPNGRIPAIIDRDRNDANVWETGSILLYLSKFRDPQYKLHFENEQEENDMITWIFFQHGGLGPMQGQANHFLGASEKLPYAAKRYIDETKRLLSVYEDRLQNGREYLAGAGTGKYSFADIASFTWVRAAPLALGIPTLSEAGFPQIQAWLDRISSREGVKKALPEGEWVGKMTSGEGWEENIKKRTEWVYAGDGERKRDEL